MSHSPVKKQYCLNMNISLSLSVISLKSQCRNFASLYQNPWEWKVFTKIHNKLRNGRPGVITTVGSKPPFYLWTWRFPMLTNWVEGKKGLTGWGEGTYTRTICVPTCRGGCSCPCPCSGTPPPPAGAAWTRQASEISDRFSTHTGIS